MILCQMLSSQGKNAPSNPYPHYLVRLATSRYVTLQDALLDTVRQLFLGQPTLTVNQLHLAKLLITAGGLGLPHLLTLALVARASCIATLPRAAQTDPFRETLVRQEGDLLLERLRGVSGQHPAQMAGNLLEAPAGLSLRHLSRKLARSIHSKAVSDLWKRRVNLEDTLRHQWLRNLPVTLQPSRIATMAMGNGSIACPASGRQP